MQNIEQQKLDNFLLSLRWSFPCLTDLPFALIMLDTASKASSPDSY